MRKAVIVICLFFFCRQVVAQETRVENRDSLTWTVTDSTEQEEMTDYEMPTEDEQDILSDTTLHISPISITADTIAYWRSEKRFAYMANLDSLLEIKQQEELAALKKSMTPEPASFLERLWASGLIQGVFGAIAIIVVLFILYKLFLSDAVFKKASVSKKVEELPGEETLIASADYEKLIQQSYKLGDHRMVVRWLFLKTLAHLSEKELVHRSADKTNYQYLQEISADKKNEFAELVLLYEYTWYGNFAPGEEKYREIEKKFNTFNNKIQH